MYKCPNFFLYAVDYNIIENKCQKCDLSSKCKEINNTYQIQDRNEKIPVNVARDFIRDVFGVTWSANSSIIDNAKKFDCLDQLPEKNKTYFISYKNIFKLMNTPLWQILNEGKLHARKKFRG